MANNMDGRDPDEPISSEDFVTEAVLPSLAITQSRTMANEFHIMEMLTYLASKESDPNKFIGTMHDRDVSRLDAPPLNEQGLGCACFMAERRIGK